jgi:aldehyde dehydrogenase (NAD+)
MPPWPLACINIGIEFGQSVLAVHMIVVARSLRRDCFCSSRYISNPLTSIYRLCNLKPSGTLNALNGTERESSPPVKASFEDCIHSIKRHSMTSAIRSFHRLFIGGQWVKPAGKNLLSVVSPSTEEVIATMPAATSADFDAAVAAAREAFDHGPWPRMTPSERASVLARVPLEIDKREDEIADSFCHEVGGPGFLAGFMASQAKRMWADAATLYSRFNFEEKREWDNGYGYLIHEPVGVVATILPWNGPVPTASLKIAPALAAGCTVVIKPAPEAPIGTLILAEALEAAGFPEGVISLMPAGREMGEYLVAHPGVDKVAFTGSTAAGAKIMAVCAQRIARVTLELGGKSAAIIADDIELDPLVPSLVFNAVGHSGQICAALTRVLIHRDRHDELVNKMAESIRALKVGDPLDAATNLGPLISSAQRDRVESYIAIGKAEGARLVVGGGRPAGLKRGWYIEPTLFANVRNDMRIAQEEIFGPVITVIPFDDTDHAVTIANDSEYGLSGAVYANDVALAESMARRIRTGQISINSWDMCVVQPFGGFKKSGLGREGGIEGLQQYLEPKLIQFAKK